VHAPDRILVRAEFGPSKVLSTLLYGDSYLLGIESLKHGVS